MQYNQGKRTAARKGEKRKQFKAVVYQRGSGGLGKLVGSYHISKSEFDRYFPTFGIYFSFDGSNWVKKMTKGRPFDYVNFYGPDRAYIKRVYDHSHKQDRGR